MSISKKLFLTMASLILAISLVFVLVSQFVVKDSINYMDLTDRSKEIENLSNVFKEYYKKHNGSWYDVEIIQLPKESYSIHLVTCFRVFSINHEQLYTTGAVSYRDVMKLGIQKSVKIDGETIAYLYYYDTEIANISKIRMGISSSVTFLLFTTAITIIIFSLIIAYWLSKRLTAPLRQLIPAIDRLRQGEHGTQVTVTTKDEYRKVAQSFNEMSSQLELTEKIRKNLVADVAHELRTPLTIIRGKLDLFQQSDQPIKPENLLPLQDELIRLTLLIDDLHQLSLSEAGKLSLELKPTDITVLLQRIVERVTFESDIKKINIEFKCFTNNPIINIDSNRMTQVFFNLLTNAIRYTPYNGKVTLTVEDEKGVNGEPVQLLIKIIDTGNGVEPEHLPFIFNRFYRTDQARTRNNGGMGLGLAIAKEFVLAHSGNIEVDSHLGQGSTFIIKLPFVQ